MLIAHNNKRLNPLLIIKGAKPLEKRRIAMKSLMVALVLALFLPGAAMAQQMTVVYQGQGFAFSFSCSQPMGCGQPVCAQPVYRQPVYGQRAVYAQPMHYGQQGGCCGQPMVGVSGMYRSPGYNVGGYYSSGGGGYGIPSGGYGGIPYGAGYGAPRRMSSSEAYLNRSLNNYFRTNQNWFR